MSTAPDMAARALAKDPNGDLRADVPQFLVKFYKTVGFGGRDYIGTVEEATADEVARIEEVFRARFPPHCADVLPNTTVHWETWATKRSGKIQRNKPDDAGKFSLTPTRPAEAIGPASLATPLFSGVNAGAPGAFYNSAATGAGQLQYGACPFCFGYLMPGVHHDCPMRPHAQAQQPQPDHRIDDLTRRLDEERRERDREREEARRQRDEARQEAERVRLEGEKAREEERRARDEDRREWQRRYEEEKHEREREGALRETDTKFNTLVTEMRADRQSFERTLTEAKAEAQRTRDDFAKRIEDQGRDFERRLAELVKEATKPKTSAEEIIRGVRQSMEALVTPLLTLYTENQKLAAIAKSENDKHAIDATESNQKMMLTLLSRGDDFVKSALQKQPESEVLAKVMGSYAQSMSIIGDVTTRIIRSAAAEAGQEENGLHKLGQTLLEGGFSMGMQWLAGRYGFPPPRGGGGENEEQAVEPARRVLSAPSPSTMPPGLPAPAPQPSAQNAAPPASTVKYQPSSDEVIFRTRVLPAAAKARDPRTAAEFIVEWAERAEQYGLTDPKDSAFDPTIASFFPSEDAPNQPERWVLSAVGEWLKSEWFEGESGEAAKFAPAVWREVKAILKERTEEAEGERGGEGASNQTEVE